MASGEVHFPPFRLDLEDERLWRASESLRLTPRAFATLRYLVQHPGRLVTKAELIEAVWPQVHVGEAVLKGCISEIRQAIQDSAGAPRVIETVHRRGYRFVGALGSPPGGADDDTPVATAARPAVPLVGREREQAVLRSCLLQALNGERQIVVLTGEPGIGKTSLVEAFLREPAGDAKFWVARGQCIDQGGIGEAYLPVLEALGRLCRERSGERLVPLLRRYAPTWLAQMPALVGVEDSRALQRETLGATPDRMLREMAEAIDALTAETPLVLLLEDLHWSDRGTVDLLSSLARRPDVARILLIGTYRDVDLVGRPHPLRTALQELQLHQRCRELRLELLDAQAVADYLAARFRRHRFPEALARLIHERTDGHPLFLRDVVDDLVCQGSIVEGETGWALQLPLDELHVGVPSSLPHMIERQIDRLTPGEQGILEAASLAGIEFSAAEVAAALEIDVDRVEALSDRLARCQQFLRALGPGDPGTGVSRYAFRHSLYRQFLGDRLTETRRARLHQRIGEYKESAGRAAEIAPELAAHFERARDHVRAVHYLGQSADNAGRRHANREAVGYLWRALELVEHVPPPERESRRRALLEQLGLARRSMGNMREAAEAFAALAEAARAHGHLDAQLRALLQEAGTLIWIDRERSVAAAEQAVELSHELPDEFLRTQARGALAFGNLLSRGWRQEDVGACLEAMAAARQVGDRAALSLFVARAAYLQCHQSQYREGCRTAEEGLQLTLETDDAYRYMVCQFHRAWALVHLGEWGEALASFADGMQKAQRNGHRPWERSFQFGTALLHVEAGDFASARALCERELGRPDEVQLGRFLGLIVLGRAHLGLEQPERALQCYLEVRQHLEDEHILMDWILRLPLHLGLAECWLAQGQVERARREAVVLCELAARPPERTYLALGRRMLAETARIAGDRVRAGRELALALSVLDRAEAPLAEWRVHEAAARLYGERKQTTRARHHRAQGAAVLTRLADSLRDWPELTRCLLATPDARALRSRS
jgi:DNA-binding winged helix-turn-helix (wHTH) protein/tetratricopeptide (TPR) repeat protein